MQRPFYESALKVGAIGGAIGIVVTAVQVAINLVGFEDGKPTGKVIKELRAEVRENQSKDNIRDSVANRGIAELRQLVIDNKNATDNNTAILCFLIKSPLPLCNEVLKSRGLK